MSSSGYKAKIFKVEPMKLSIFPEGFFGLFFSLCMAKRRGREKERVRGRLNCAWLWLGNVKSYMDLIAIF